MHSVTFRLRNHPSRHRKERDDAALLTQEGNSHAFTVSIILCAELIWTAVVTDRAYRCKETRQTPHHRRYFFNEAGSDSFFGDAFCSTATRF
jgi:hypothetical protein